MSVRESVGLHVHINWQNSNEGAGVYNKNFLLIYQIDSHITFVTHTSFICNKSC